MADNDVLTEESVLQLVNQLIAIEAASREAADAQEIINRQAGDDVLAQLINQESDERTTALTGLQTAVNQSITRIDGNVSQLQALFNQRYETITNLISNLNISVGESNNQVLFDAKAYTDEKISEVLDGAPAILDTLKELSNALGGDGNFVTTINAAVAAETATRQQQISDLQAAIAALGGDIGNDLSEAIDSLGEAISAEVSARIAADTNVLQAAKQHSDTNKQQIFNLLSANLVKKQRLTITAAHVAQGYVELPHTNIIIGSLDAFVDRLGIFQDEDFELLEVNNKTRLKFINSFGFGGDEEIEVGSELRVKYWTL